MFVVFEATLEFLGAKVICLGGRQRLTSFSDLYQKRYNIPQAVGIVTGDIFQIDYSIPSRANIVSLVNTVIMIFSGKQYIASCRHDYGL